MAEESAQLPTASHPGTVAPVVVPDWLEELCNRVAGGEGIKEITADEHMPCRATVYETMAKNAVVQTRIARAREAQQSSEIDAMVEMADQATAENWQVVRLRIWARQWRAAKLNPKLCGDRHVLAGDEDAPLVIREVSNRDRAKALASLVAKQRGR